MQPSAQNASNFSRKKTQVLITDIGSYLATSLAESLLAQNCLVVGVGKIPQTSDLINNPDFTLMELDLNQPLPAYLPVFDYIFYLNLLDYDFKNSSLGKPNFTPATRNITAIASNGKTKVIIITPLTADANFFEYLSTNNQSSQNIKFLLVGDLYGPKMPLASQVDSGFYTNQLSRLIYQAVTSDKVILENEGLSIIYPTYISDAIFAINKFSFSEDENKNQFIISEEGITALSIAYEIQNAVSVSANKNVNLFFSGSQPAVIAPHANIEIHKLNFSPKIRLNEGLKNTFDYFLKEKAIVQPQKPLQTIQGSSQTLVQPTVQKEILTPLEKAHAVIGRISDRSKIKSYLFKPQKKMIILGLITLVILILGKTALDIYLGVANLKQARQYAFSGNLTKAKIKSKSAQKNFQAAQNKTKMITWPLRLIFPLSVDSFNTALLSASVGSNSLVYFIEGSQILMDNLSIIINANLKNEGFDLDTSSANFRRAYFKASYANQIIQKADSNLLKNRINTLKSTLSDLMLLSSSTLELNNITLDFVGDTKGKSYLVLLQNNNELRPGGGFIGNVGKIEFDAGKLKNIAIEDVYTYDGQLKEIIEPPKQLKEKLGLTQFFLRDSNWNGDFSLNAGVARDFYKKETGQDVDGVIALDLTFIQNILETIGPIKLEDYNEEITSKNLFERGTYYSEVGFFPGSTAKSDFFGALTRALISKILNNISQGPTIGLVKNIKNAINEKHLMVVLDSNNLGSFVQAKGWDYPLPPKYFNPAEDISETRDFLALSEANLGANKVNRFLDRKISYEMTIGRDADLNAKLKILYTNNSQAQTWPAGKYVNFLRVYVPFASELKEYKNGDLVDLTNVEVTTSGGLNVFSTFVEVGVNSSKEVIFTYRIPKNIQLEKAPIYHLYVEKQAGTGEDPFEFTFNLPGYLKVKSVNNSDEQEGKQNLFIQTDLTTDRQFEIEVAKK